MRSPYRRWPCPNAVFGVLFALLAFLSAGRPALAWQPDYTLHISSAPIAADCTVRNSVTINGTSPGPTIRVREGEHVWIRVYNDMVDQNTTLHFHGVAQYMSPFADGTPQTSQWPIAPKNYFDYEFMLTKGSAGTYFYHSHVGFEIVTAYGAFIVEDSTTSSKSAAYDEELTLLLGDFYHEPDLNITAGLLGAPFTWPNDPQALTVNGKAFGQCTPNSTAKPAVTCESGCHTEILNVKPGKTYLVRTIGGTVLSFLYMRIESHSDLVLTEVDAHPVRPFPISYIQIDSGQRYSFLLKTKTEEELEAEGQTVFWANMESRWRSTRVFGGWLLNYDYELKSKSGASAENSSASTTTTTTAVSGSQTNATALAYAPLPQLNLTLPLPNETETGGESETGPFWVIPSLEPLDEEEGCPPGDDEVSRRVYVQMEQLSSGTGNAEKIFWNVNGYMYSELYPSTPYLVQAYSPIGLYPNYTVAEANLGFDESTKTFPIRLNETIEFVFMNLASFVGSLEAHPWHFHGPHPWLMGMGLGNFSDEAFAAARAQMTGKPIRRDTQVLFPGPYGADYNASAPAITPGEEGGWMVFRLKATNPGAYLLHCHTMPHLTMGMGTVFLVGMEGNGSGPDSTLPKLPPGFVEEYMKYNASHASEPQSYFELFSL